MEIETDNFNSNVEVHFGGPVESGRGFVLHSTDYDSAETMRVNSDFAVTATVEVLKSIASGKGPSNAMFALGYSGWAPGQLDTEMQNNGWLHCKADLSIVFGEDHEAKWKLAAAKMGVDLSLLTADAGHA